MNRASYEKMIQKVMTTVMCLILAGCGYRLGTSLPEGFDSIYVAPFINKTSEPAVENEATRATINDFLKDGTLEVVDKESADLALTTTITGYELDALQYDEETAATPEEYRLTIAAKVVLENGVTGDIMMTANRIGQSTFFMSGDLTTSKNDALPEACEDLAHRIVESVVEYW